MSRYRPAAVLGAATSLICGLLLVAAPASAATDRTPPTTPANLRITASTDFSVSLAWNPSTDNSSNFWYCVEHNGGGCLRVDQPRTTLTRARLLPNTTHTFSVFAIDIAGNRSANSNTVRFTTPPDTTPPSPAPTLSVATLFPTRVTLTWPQAVDDTSPQVWTTLLIDGRPVFVDRLGPPSTTVFALTPQTTYTFQASVRDRDGNRVTGPPLAVTTPPKTDENAPTAPANLRASNPGAGEVRLRWDPSLDDTDPQSEIRYEVFQDGDLVASAIVGQTHLVLGCPHLGPTELFVRAADTSGNTSGPSNTVTFNCTQLP
jgi:chitodextrinase